jgi:Ser/Thr protein kinase RdoA (MazF antagonist)
MLATLLFLLAAEPDVVVSRSAAIPAIERILKADNLDVDGLAPQEIAAAMRDIRQGAAPRDFWVAYQAHVRAWSDYAAGLDAAAKRQPGEPPPAGSEWAVGEARTHINATFDTVERLARTRGATIPLPRTRI